MLAESLRSISLVPALAALLATSRAGTLLIRVIVVAAVTFAGSARAQNTLTGNTEGGAFYRIEVPADWNGDLVIFNHGMGPDTEVEPVTDLGPLSIWQLNQGYAVAASSYSTTGRKAGFVTNSDLEHLYEVFEERVGEPGAVFITGSSFGTGVSSRAIEKAQIGNVVGALLVCGAPSGGAELPRTLDPRLLYDVICSNTPEAAISGGAQGLPAGSSLTLEELVERVDACFENNSALFEQLIGTPTRSGVHSVFLGWADLIHNQLGGEVPIGNEDVVYGDPDDLTDPLHDEIVRVNAEIARVTPNPEAANLLARAVVPTGFVGSTKIVAYHTDKDPVAFVEEQAFYESVIPAESLTTAIVVEDEPSHCGFTTTEHVAAWEALRAWTGVDVGFGVPVGVQPTAAEIQALCQELGFGACRFDPDFVLDFPGRLREVFPPPCSVAPLVACLGAAKASLAVIEKKPGNEKLKATLKSFDAAITQADLDPIAADGSNYALCIYDAADQLAGELSIARAGGRCDPKQKPCWKAKGDKGYSYKDAATAAAGVKKIAALSGPAGKGKLQIQAGNKSRKGQDSMPTGIAALLAGAPSATIQAQLSGGACFEATLGTVKKNDATQFKAKAP